jgi:hypothetical protein
VQRMIEKRTFMVAKQSLVVPGLSNMWHSWRLIYSPELVSSSQRVNVRGHIYTNQTGQNYCGAARVY